VTDVSLFITLKYLAPGATRMQSTTVRKPEDWNGMSTQERRTWAEAQCNRVCPGATKVGLR